MPSSPKTTIYGFGLSQPSRAVLWAAKIKQLPFHFESVNPISGETQTEAFLSKFPLGTIPSLEVKRGSSSVCHDAEIAAIATSADGSSTASPETEEGRGKKMEADASNHQTAAETSLPPFRLSEGGAILVYLCEANGWRDLHPSVADGGREALRQRARVDQWLHWYHTNLRFATTDVFAPAVKARMKENLKNCSLGTLVTTEANVALSETPVDEERQQESSEQRKREKHHRDMWDHALKTKTNGALKDHPFLAGDAVSIADLLCYCEIDQIHFAGLYDFKAWQAVWAWMQRMQQVPEHDSVRKDLFELLEQVGMLTNYSSSQPAKAADKGKMKSPSETNDAVLSSPSCDS